MTTLVDRILTKFGLLPSTSPSKVILTPLVWHKDKHAARLEDMSNIPRYPPFMEGLPVHSPAALLATQNELTSGIQQLIANRELLEAHYNPSMLRLAEFVQLLPASQSHHHRGAGGLLRHSLEVGLWALQQTEGKLIRGVITPQKRRLIEPRWRLAAFLGGICHDLGKVLTDFTVTDRAGGLKWRPYMQGLYQWADENKVERYFMHWTDGRGKNHTNVSGTLIESVVSRKTLDWIGEGSTEVMIWLTESLNNNPGSTNQIHNFVVKADQLSVERDLKSMGAAMAGYEIGVPIERYLADIMRRLVQEGLWRINEPSARVWSIEGTTYLVWPMAGEEIARRTRDEDIAGLPKTPDGILDMLVEREMAFLRDGSGDDPFFYIAPDVVTAKIPNMRLRSIRLRDQALISSMPLSSVTGKIYTCKADPEVDAMPDAEQVGIIADTGVTSQHDPSTPTAHFVESGTDAVTVQRVPSTATAHLAESPGAGTEFQLVSSPPLAPVKKMAIGLDALEGAVGEVVRVLVAEFESGQKSFAEFGIKQPDGSVCLKWPVTFASYGLTGKEILDYFCDNGWLIPASDVAKIGDAEFADGVAKSVRLTAEIGALFLAAKPSGKKKTKPAPALPAPVQAVVLPVASQPDATASAVSTAAGAAVVATQKIRKPAKQKTKAAGEIAGRKKPSVATTKAVPGGGNKASAREARRDRHPNNQTKGESIE